MPQTIVLGTNTSNPFYNQAWYLDSCDTHHVTLNALTLMDDMTLLRSN